MAGEVGNKDMESEAAQLEKVNSSYKIRAYLASSLPEELQNVVRAPFITTLRYGNELFKLIDQESYYLNYSRYISNLLKRPKAIIRMATSYDLVTGEDVVLGWCLSELDTVHYVWVKKEVWRQGICKALLPKDFTTISHITNKGLSLWSSKYPKVKFNPFA